jgi:menaquinone-specific isochorismate synthase
VLDLANVMHLATDVTGTVVDGSTSLGLLASLHPSAAVCGAPTETARAVIDEIEDLSRGRYAGPVGWLDARGDGEWGIALRCAEVDPPTPRGCGCSPAAASSRAPRRSTSWPRARPSCCRWCRRSSRLPDGSADR